MVVNLSQKMNLSMILIVYTNVAESLRGLPTAQMEVLPY